MLAAWWFMVHFVSYITGANNEVEVIINIILSWVWCNTNTALKHETCNDA